MRFLQFKYKFSFSRIKCHNLYVWILNGTLYTKYKNIIKNCKLREMKKLGGNIERSTVTHRNTNMYNDTHEYKNVFFEANTKYITQ